MSAPHNKHLAALLVTSPAEAVATMRKAIEACGGNVSAAARLLHIHVRTLWRHIGEHPGIHPRNHSTKAKKKEGM